MEGLTVDARLRVMADVQLRATVVVIRHRVMGAAIRRQVAMVADRTAVVGHTVVDRMAVDMGGKASLDSCPSVAT